MSNKLIASLLMYPAIRREILEIASANGEVAQAEQLVQDLDRALVELGELAVEIDQSGFRRDADFCARMRMESLEIRNASARFRGISETSDKIADLFAQLATWLDSEFDDPSVARRKSNLN